MGFYILNHLFWGTIIYGNLHTVSCHPPMPRGHAPVSGRFTDLVPALLVLQHGIHPPTVVGEVGSKEGGAPRPGTTRSTISTGQRSIPSPYLGVPFVFLTCGWLPQGHAKIIKHPGVGACPSRADPKMSILGCPSCRTRLRPMPLPVCCMDPSFRGLSLGGEGPWRASQFHPGLPHRQRSGW